MTRMSLVIAAAYLALMTVPAPAQTSYESRGYGGPLGIGPNFHPGEPSRARRAKRRRRYRPSTSSKAGQRESVDTTKKKAVTENSTIVTELPEAEKKKVVTENSSIVTVSPRAGETVAQTTAGAKPKSQTKAPAGATNCRRFIASVGKTVSVDCD